MFKVTVPIKPLQDFLKAICPVIPRSKKGSIHENISFYKSDQGKTYLQYSTLESSLSMEVDLEGDMPRGFNICGAKDLLKFIGKKKYPEDDVAIIDVEDSRQTVTLPNGKSEVFRDLSCYVDISFFETYYPVDKEEKIVSFPMDAQELYRRYKSIEFVEGEKNKISQDYVAFLHGDMMVMSSHQIALSESRNEFTEELILISKQDLKMATPLFKEKVFIKEIPGMFILESGKVALGVRQPLSLMGIYEFLKYKRYVYDAMSKCEPCTIKNLELLGRNIKSLKEKAPEINADRHQAVIFNDKRMYPPGLMWHDRESVEHFIPMDKSLIDPFRVNSTYLLDFLKSSKCEAGVFYKEKRDISPIVIETQEIKFLLLTIRMASSYK